MTIGFNVVASGEKVAEMTKEEMLQRAYPASNVLRNEAIKVLTGLRSGRRYKVPFKKVMYTASAPGEPPAVRTGNLRASWVALPRVNRGDDGVLEFRPSVHSSVPYNKYLDPHFGDSERSEEKYHPYVDKIRERASSEIKEIYSRPYLGG